MESIDIGRAVKTPFEDKQWLTKSLLAILWTFLIVTIPAIAGAQVEYIKRVSEGREDIPDWSNFGEKWVKGFLVAVAGFIYFLPVVIIGAAVLVPAAISYAFGSQSDGSSALLAGGVILFAMLAIAYALVVTLFFYAALTHYALSGRFGAFFEFGQISARIKNTGYFTAWLWTWLVSLVSSAVTGALTATWIGSILTPAVSFLAFMMTAHLLGQYAANAYGLRRPAAASAAPGYPPPAATPAAPPAYTPPTAPPPPPTYAPSAAPPPAPVATPAAPTTPEMTPPPPPVMPETTPAPAPPAEAPPAPPAAPETMPPPAPPAGEQAPPAPEPPAEGPSEST